MGLPNVTECPPVKRVGLAISSTEVNILGSESREENRSTTPNQRQNTFLRAYTEVRRQGDMASSGERASNKKMDKLQSEVDEVTDLLKDNVDKILQRGEKLERLEERGFECRGKQIQSSVFKPQKEILLAELQDGIGPDRGNTAVTCSYRWDYSWSGETLGKWWFSQWDCNTLKQQDKVSTSY
ncbi:Vesicle-associated membrane protein 3 [Branchiostoma belcheri]|nr:Vesicle-associated membrane protein 3 [Branchiostoma belcheri]